MTTTLFKKCSCCDKEWTTREAFISDKTNEPLGEWEGTGLLLFNCLCKSTITIEVSEGSKDEARQLRELNKKRKV